MKDTSHLVAIHDRLTREKNRLAFAMDSNEIAFRQQRVLSAEKELAQEYEFLGMAPEVEAMSLDDLFAELSA